MVNSLVRIEDRVAKIEEIGIFITLGGLVVCLFIQVVFRFLIQLPLSFTEEMSRILLIWVIFLGAAYGTFKAEHFVVDFVFNLFPGGVKRVTGLLLDLLTIVFLGALVWIGWRASIMGSIQMLPTLGISVMTQTMAFPIGCALMAFHTAMLIVRRYAGIGSELPAGQERLAENANEAL